MHVAGELDELRGNEAQNAEHCNSAVLDLRLLEELDIDPVGKAERIETDLTGDADKVRRLGEERHGLQQGVQTSS